MSFAIIGTVLSFLLGPNILATGQVARQYNRETLRRVVLTRR